MENKRTPKWILTRGISGRRRKRRPRIKLLQAMEEDFREMVISDWIRARMDMDGETFAIKCLLGFQC